MPRILAAHQPEFLPYLGFFTKMLRCDVFVIRDEVQYVHTDFHRRNRIRINSHDNINEPKSAWLSVPVEKANDYIKNVRIKQGALSGHLPWRQVMLQQICSAYKQAAHFEQYYPKLQEAFNSSGGSLMELNMNLINFIRHSFCIDREIVFASVLGLKPEHFGTENQCSSSEDLALLCEKLGADVYLSGDGGKNYLDAEPFKRRGIEVRFLEYQHPTYPQVYPGFLPFMSAIDALLCIGRLPVVGQFEPYTPVDKTCGADLHQT